MSPVELAEGCAAVGCLQVSHTVAAGAGWEGAGGAGGGRGVTRGLLTRLLPEEGLEVRILAILLLHETSKCHSFRL